VKYTEEGWTWRICLAKVEISSLAFLDFGSATMRKGSEKRTHSSLPHASVTPVRLSDRRIAEVAARQPSSDLAVVLAARNDGNVKAFEVLAELGADRESARQGVEVQAVLSGEKGEWKKEG
jgi:hypothetical protein